MTTNDFNILLEDVLSNIKAVLGDKAVEYATNDDRLHNFVDASVIGSLVFGEDFNQEKALFGMQLKHLVLYLDMIKSNKTYSKEYVYEKCLDLVNYTILSMPMILKRGENVGVK